MNFHNITTDDLLNGDGLRTVLWLAGCSHHCDECQNPITWDVNGGIPFDEEAKKELFKKLEPDYISGLTLSGGDPLHPKNREEVAELCEKVHKAFPDKTIWLYTGYEFERSVIREWPGLQYIDVMVDGEYEKQRRDVTLPWRGSSNQRVIDVKKSLEMGQTVEWVSK